MSGSRAARKLAVAVSLLPLLAACGSEAASRTAGDGRDPAAASGQLEAPADASADLKKQYLVENSIAACMKKQGFTYTPVAPEDPAASWATDGADYQLTKKQRQKYGFGIYSAAVYPDDPQAPGSNASRKDSTDTVHADYVATLTPEQRTAYEKALGGPPDPKTGAKDWTGCQGTADKQVYGSTTPQQRSEETATRMQANGQALNGDPKLITLAQSYASCLRKDGIPVTTTQPTSIGEMVKLQANVSAPVGAGAGAAALNPDGTPIEPIGKAEALPLLTKDIALAMQDLECGKAFRAAFFPKFFKAPAAIGGGAG
ncbi:hypothetical protein ACIP98_28345 [Streptomyces sp. NPDC088354]|uniref:hypothetical protein n=1 Tax=unclassified Streptomyces TaxID=2593676 RepID=UPI0029B2E8CB|nr:hypothetical protein [Streptomyces sp. MI02-7b]MDX3076146.1 hypothetical protein [Streptomyces sp. MI02-7b]